MKTGKACRLYHGTVAPAVLLALSFCACGYDAGAADVQSRVVINPPGTTWLEPDREGGRLWKSVRIPQRFYFRRDQGDRILCTDRMGKILWEREHKGRPLWGFNYDCRAFETHSEKAVTIIWVSVRNGRQSLALDIPKPKHTWRDTVVLGLDQGNLLCRWEDGMPPLGAWPYFTKAPLRFYSGGRSVATWDPSQEGYRLLGSIGRDGEGRYSVIAEKDRKGMGLALDGDGKRLRLLFSPKGKLLGAKPVDYSEELFLFVGEATRGIRGCGYQFAGEKTLVVTKEKVYPNVWDGAGAFTRDLSGRRMPVTVLWTVQTEDGISDISAEHEGMIYLLTSSTVDRGVERSIVQVSTKSRKIVSVMDLGDAVWRVMGPGDLLYSHEVKKTEDNGYRKVLWRHALN